MQFNSIALRGMGPFQGEARLDLDSISDRIVAITGANGAGKSTLLELLPGALYRTTPTRGTLASMATTRESYVEIGVTNGERYTIRQTIDAVSGKGEAMVFDAAGVALTDSGKVREYDAWASMHLPSPDVLYASTFTPQGSGGFLELKPAERKSVLLRVLGIEHLERLAERARARRSEMRNQLNIVAARIEDEANRANVHGVAELEIDLANTQFACSRVESEYQSATALLAHTGDEIAAWENVTRERDAAIQQRESLNTERAALQQTINGLQERINTNNAVVARRDEIQSAASRRATIDSLLSANQQESVRLYARIRELETAILHHSQTNHTLATSYKNAQGEIDRLDQLLANSIKIRAAEDSLPVLRDNLAQCEANFRDAEAHVERLRSLRLVSVEGRIEGLRSGLECIRDCEESEYGDIFEAPEIAAETLDGDDDAIRAAITLPDLIDSALRVLTEKRHALEATRVELRIVETLAAEGPHLTLAAEQRQTAASTIADCTRQMGATEVALLIARIELEATRNEVAENAAAIEILQSERASIAPAVALAESLTQAETRLTELYTQFDNAVARDDALFNTMESLIVPSDPGLKPSTVIHEGIIAACEKRLRELPSAIALLEHSITQAREAEARLAALRAEQSSSQSELSDWVRLADDLGKDGLQALEIDAAGPELTELINDLLRSCVGSRWTVSVETTRQSADGKRQLEGCDVRVLDTLRGRDATAETLSGGERVIVSEAIALALSMLACRRAGVEAPTLIRDESGAALDPENGRAYIAMLRRASEIIGASKVLFVSHTTELQELADARIHIEDGGISIR